MSGRLALLPRALALLLLSGCAPGIPDPTHTPLPVFETEAEAISAAEDSYAAYLGVSDAIAHDFGANPERITSVVVADEVEGEIEGFAKFASSGTRFDGATTFALQLQAITSRNPVQLTAFVCVDVSGVAVLDSAGHDITPKDRPPRVPLEVVFESSPERPRTLLVGRSEVWSDSSSC